jgi:phage shock protein E
MDFLSQIFSQPGVEQLEPDQLNSLVSQTPRPYLLDVRNPDEYRECHISGAELIPLHELGARLHSIPKGRTVVCICASGSRSSMAARQLSAQGYQVKNLRGGMSRWLRAGLPYKTGAVK